MALSIQAGLGVLAGQDNAEKIRSLLQQARDELGQNGGFRLRTLLDMTLIELDREVAKAPQPDKLSAPSAE